LGASKLYRGADVTHGKDVGAASAEDAGAASAETAMEAKTGMMSDDE
jgi:hypothetical protein